MTMYSLCTSSKTTGPTGGVGRSEGQKKKVQYDTDTVTERLDRDSAVIHRMGGGFTYQPL